MRTTMKKNRLRTLPILLSLFLLTASAFCACSSGIVSSSGTEGTEKTEKTERTEKTTYQPAVFTVQGGTGKVTITCPEVVVTDGDAQACIVFSSPYYEWVRSDSVQYDSQNAGEEGRKTSVFRIPVRLDEEMKITGLTTAMSEPHEVEYTIFISLTPDSVPPGEKEADRPSEPEEDSLPPDESEETYAQRRQEASGAENSIPPDLPGLTFVSAMDTVYAETFDIYTYRTAGSDSLAAEDASPSGLYHLIDVHGSGQYLLVPESGAGIAIPQDESTQQEERLQQDESTQQGTSLPQNESTRQGTNLRQDESTQQEARLRQGESTRQALKEAEERQEEILAAIPASITVLRAPLENLYVAATSSMALFDAAGAIGQVKLTGTKAEGWYIDAPKKALQDGTMIYAGKYSAPDYELLASSGCDLAVESMMILHTPEVREKLEELGIPVFIDTSSNESHPLGRTEWVRLYGVLTGHEKEAEAFFETQKEQYAKTDSYTKTEQTVAFFSISANGNVIVRASDDYIPRMIGIAGGNYVFENLLSESGKSASVRLSMEDFYNTAKDADYLIYNATIEKPVGSIAELCGRSSLLSDFKAVQSGSVWQVRRSLYQSPDLAAQMIGDIHEMLTGQPEADMVFLEKVN